MVLRFHSLRPRFQHLNPRFQSPRLLLYSPQNAIESLCLLFDRLSDLGEVAG
jgi:hypothetical protein